MPDHQGNRRDSKSTCVIDARYREALELLNLRQNYVAGIFVAGIGLFFSIAAFANLPIGNVARMGPGFFPLAVGIFLMGIGVVLGLSGKRSDALDLRTIPFRGVALIATSLIVFTLILAPLGFLGSVAVCVFIASRAHDGLTLLASTIAALVVSLMCGIIFVVLLGQNIPLLGTLLGG